MDNIYKVKEKWAQCFMTESFTLVMRSTQLSESLHNDLKNHLKSDLDINRFFHHFERDVVMTGLSYTRRGPTVGPIRGLAHYQFRVLALYILVVTRQTIKQ
jgi:hypothetical protein